MLLRLLGVVFLIATGDRMDPRIRDQSVRVTLRSGEEVSVLSHLQDGTESPATLFKVPRSFRRPRTFFDFGRGDSSVPKEFAQSRTCCCFSAHSLRTLETAASSIACTAITLLSRGPSPRLGSLLLLLDRTRGETFPSGDFIS